jgi:2-polyprenyl-3-methyl-5-hydroxy-6-metoxy-1,4-benzoquinol methylase
MTLDYSFTRYLEAKRSVDDRALNGHVWQTWLETVPQHRSLRILEVGAGIGTMVERLLERDVLPGPVAYTAIDAEAANIAVAHGRLSALHDSWSLTLETIDLAAFAAREKGRQRWDVIIAHAFLDLVPLPETLILLFDLLEPDGTFYFTINFDGETILQPVIDPAFDAKVLRLYHQTMDERVIDGRPSGHSRTGRRMFTYLQAAGAQTLAAGSSDWVVYAGPAGYAADEAYFLHFIIHTMAGALQGHPELERHLFDAWIAQRHAQIDAGTLVYIAHQLDFCGRLQPAAD